jgi:predicted metal-dependent hydrolase
MIPNPLRALLYRRPSKPSDAMVEIVVDFEQASYPVRVRKHGKARRYTLRIDSVTREVVLSMPPHGSIKKARAFAQNHGSWIAARLRKCGINHRIEHRHGARGTVWIEAGNDGSHVICVAGEAPHIGRRVRDFLKREAKRDFEAASRRAAAQLGVRVQRVSIRDQSSRWGSCSSTGVLSYSWRLIMAPDFVIEYLASHEVAHLVEMNHSRRFWRQVESICPHVARAKAWLIAHGPELHRYELRDSAR